MDGASLRKRRVALRLTQAEFGQRIGLSRVMVGLMERGQRSIPPRTAVAISAVQPRPLERCAETYAPLTVKLEKALISAGVNYIADHPAGDRMIDFYLPELRVALYVETSRAERRRDMTTEIDTISIAGKSALGAFITLIQYGGIHARLNAGRDPYAEEV